MKVVIQLQSGIQVVYIFVLIDLFIKALKKTAFKLMDYFVIFDFSKFTHYLLTGFLLISFGFNSPPLVAHLACVFGF